MLKHISTGQPSSGGSSSRHHHYPEYQGSGVGGLHHQHHGLQEHLHQHYPSRGPVRPGSDVYDSVIHSGPRGPPGAHHPATTTPSSGHRHPLTHSQLSVNNLSQRLNHSHALNLSTLSTSKHSVNSVSPVAGPVATGPGHVQALDRSKANGGLDISRLSRLPSQATPSPAPLAAAVLVPGAAGPGHPVPPTLDASWSCTLSRRDRAQEAGVREMLTSLGLLCLVSLLLALLSLTFLLKISPLTVTPSSLISPEEYAIVYEVTLALCALALSLNLCCLLVCAIQFLFTVKLVKSSYQGHRTNKYLQKSSISRVCAVGGFFISIPVFLTGMILYTFIQFHSTPAIVTSVFIGLGILFCGCAMVHNVFVWQREKTNAIKELAREQCEAAAQLQRQHQQLQQLQQQQSQQPRPSLSLHHGVCAPKIAIAPLVATHGHQVHAGSHRNVATPTTPAEGTPPSPANTSKLNRSHYLPREATGSVSPGLPAATLDLSSAATTNSPHELSTLV
ncbi:uncharacterized protein LOC105695500 isoform X2 [Orussus abietinus]|uniref:uncharacterized protein LOC105695500 isoform X2 n=1 Tax=Orussus abietinus TaxID=222816 RepID=UPI000626BEB2|nr:uncharacterized protein LOC105695500 isoform X2 [Orussus abietinus]